MIDVQFEEYQCDVKITDEEGKVHTLNLNKLLEKIEPQNSTWRFSASSNRITISLKKWLETAWTDLTRAAPKKK